MHRTFQPQQFILTYRPQILDLLCLKLQFCHSLQYVPDDERQHQFHLPTWKFSPIRRIIKMLPHSSNRLVLDHLLRDFLATALSLIT